MPTGPVTVAETVTEEPKAIGLLGVNVAALTVAVAWLTVKDEGRLVLEE